MLSNMNSDASGEVPVVIVGAGPVGLALANDLSWRGIPTVLIDRRTEPLNFPTSESIHTRTMEQFRVWGIAEEVRFAGFPPDMPRDVHFATRVTGYRLGRVPRASNRLQQEISSPISPEGPIWCPKFLFESVMRKALAKGGATQFLFGHEVVSFDEDETGVTVCVKELATGRDFSLRCRYLAACDGASSGIRKSLDISLQGTFAEGRNLGIFLRSAQLRSLMQDRAGVMVDIVNPDFSANLSAVDGQDLWRLIIFMRDGDPGGLDPATCVRQTVGCDIDAEILDARAWAGHTVVAERFRKGRAFLLGDAAHLLWPRGGFGMNTGVGDAANLGWKLGAVLKGWGGAGLLDSYEAERRPVALRNVAEAALNYRSEASLPVSAAIEDAGALGDAQRQALAEAIVATRAREWNTMGLQLGFRYDDSPVCWSDGSAVGSNDNAQYVPTTRAGARAPHAWVRPGVSTLDYFGRGFCLVHHGGESTVGFEAAAAGRGIPLSALELEENASAELYERKFVLVRPDGHVAWRSNELPADAGHILDRAAGINCIGR
ncbi:FAD-dependent monooxygenase [Paraburkholderia sediminicola]|uniref:FAD-dependent monooxygenase n=1 Tax=Paraburkholderia sediminicola TaxID=458836 RepID=UPI0038BC7643